MERQVETAKQQRAKVGVVTGASLGLGAAMAAALVRDGWELVIDGRDPVALHAAAHRLGPAHVVAVPGDVANPEHREAMAAAVRQLGPLDLLVNNASILGPSPQPGLIDYPLDALRAVYEVNVVAPLALLQVLAPSLRAATHAQVVNITSDAAVEPYEGWGGYGSSKAALDQVTAIWAAEQAWCRTWSVDPGDMRTRLHQEAFPGEDISDRPDPTSVVPALLALLSADPPSGRIRLAALDRQEAIR